MGAELQAVSWEPWSVVSCGQRVASREMRSTREKKWDL